MPHTPTLSSAPESDPALDQQQLFSIGMDYVRTYSGQRWTDHNLHDPGITILELASYALTDLAYRAKFPLEDLLATETDNAANMAGQFFTARRILPNRPLTVNDYRKLLIDLKGVKNAWIAEAPARFFADPQQQQRMLRHDDPGTPGIRPVELKGLYRALIEFDYSADQTAERDAIRAKALALLQANRNLCEDFVDVLPVADHYYALCAELELTPGAEPIEVAAQIQFAVEDYFSPPVLNHSLEDMQARIHPDGSPYTTEDIFQGPALRHGFIDDAELEASALRTEIRLSDIIRLIIGIDGVLAVRDIRLNPLSPGAKPDDAPIAPADPWRVAVPTGCRPRLSPLSVMGRLVCYQRGVPVLVLDKNTGSAQTKQVERRLKRLFKAQEAWSDSKTAEDRPIPLGRFRNVAAYHSLQNHFPPLYGLSQQGLPPGADGRRKAQALQLKAYLLLFDQLLANGVAQLANLRRLFSRDAAQARTYFAQRVDSFADAAKLYSAGVSDASLASLLENQQQAAARRDRFLDHLLARCGEDFRHYAALMRSLFGVGATAAKCAFLDACPELGAERGLAYDQTAPAAGQWNSNNVSGMERRIARLLNFKYHRRDLEDGKGGGSEGLFLIENILLRPPAGSQAFLPICPDSACADCTDDPYSHRLHLVLPAYAGRLQNMEFRRFVEETLRAETPAHLLPKVCWVDAEHMAGLQTAYREWISLEAEDPDRPDKLQALVKVLAQLKNVYPQEPLRGCGGGPDKPPFLLDHTTLGSFAAPPSPDP